MDSEPKKHDPEEIVASLMAKDFFSKFLGLEIDEARLGYCKLHYTVVEDMLNGFGIIHGGVVFSASDSALAFAGNSHGRLSVALDASITFTRSAKAGEVLTVEAVELYLGHKTGLYDIRTTNAQGELVALFKGTTYRTSQLLIQNP